MSGRLKQGKVLQLGEPFFHPLPLGAVRPRGWFARQLRVQAEGLSGHLDEFWPDIHDSAWIGGTSEGWERMPYWLDGAIPLAWILNDTAMKARITKYIDTIIKHQQPDGWLGPCAESHEAARDVWSQFLALKMLVLYHDASGDARIFEVVRKALRKLDRHVERHPLADWGQFRWFEGLIPIWWLYERIHVPWLLDLAVKLHAQGFHWGAFFRRWPLTEPTCRGRWSYMGHVVNNAMAVKCHALWWRLTGDAKDKDAVYEMIEKLERYHGMVTGVFTGDECLAGTSPVQGTELCAVMEYMYSLEILLAMFGDPVFGDRLEKIAFNALPAAFAPDMWSHQYDQQVNQVECSVCRHRSWTTNGNDANIFGLEPHYGCCTANLSQGWPKLAAHLWMKTRDHGVAAVAYAPNMLRTRIRGVPLTIVLETEYPFRNTLFFRVTTDRAVRFPLLLRIPAWTEDAVITVEGRLLHAEAGAFFRLERVWKDTVELTLTLPMRPCLSRRQHHAVAVLRGPLVYALRMGEDWRRITRDRAHGAALSADWEVYPTSAWNYALELTGPTLAEDLVFTQHPIGDLPFSPEGAPVSATVGGRRVPEWDAENGSARPTPPGPVRTSEPRETLTLIPYGCTNLRIAEFPVVAEEKTDRGTAGLSGVPAYPEGEQTDDAPAPVCNSRCRRS